MDTLEEVKLILKDLAISQAKNEAKSEKEFSELRKLQKETDKELDKLAILQAKNEAKNEKEFEKLAILQAKSENKIDKLASNLGGYEKTQSNIVEDLFFNSLFHSRTLNNIKYNHIEINKELIIDEVLKTEIDIILFNGDFIGFIEVKEKPRKRNFKEIKRKIEIYKELYKNDKRTIQGYLASFKFNDLIKNEAKKHNIKLLTLKGDIVEIL